jgi:purine nucleosidase
MMHVGVWVDTDLGFDDLAAILVLVDRGVQIDGVSLVFGNAPLPQVCENAAAIAEMFTWFPPVYSGRDRSVLGLVETAQHVLGPSGIRSIGKTLPKVTPNALGSAFTALVAWLETAGPHRILALGPLSNIAALALARPDLAARIDDLTWMGGGISSGNHTPSAEFNAFADPEALAIVLAHQLPLRIVDLDICRKVIGTPADVLPIRAAGGRHAELIADLFAGFVEIGTNRARPGMALYDPVAAVAFVSPETVVFRPARIDVELAGSLTRGRTVLDLRTSPNAAYAAEIDAAAAHEIILGALLRAASQ